MDTKDLYSDFPILGWVFAPYQEGKTLAFRLIAVYGGIYLLGCAVTWLDGTFYLPEKDLLGYIEDPVNVFLTLALAISTYLVHSLIRRFCVAFFGSEKGFSPSGGILQAVDHNPEGLKTYQGNIQGVFDFVSRKRDSAKWSYWTLRIVAIVLFIIGGLYEPLFTEHIRSNWNFLFYPLRPDLSYIQQFPASFTFNAFKDGFIYIVIIPGLVWFVLSIAIATIVILRRLQQQGVLIIIPASPDKAGGLRSIGEISLILFYIVIIQLLHIFPTSMIFNWPLFHQLIYLPFFLFAAFVFFAPLFIVRRSMKEAKRVELDNAMLEFRDLHKALARLNPLLREDRSEVESLSKMIELNGERYKKSAAMAVWPYDFGTLVRFVTGIAIPMMFYVLQMVLQESGWFQNPEAIMDLFTW